MSNECTTYTIVLHDHGQFPLTAICLCLYITIIFRHGALSLARIPQIFDMLIQGYSAVETAGGGHHSLVQTTKGLFSFGRNDSGQLGWKDEEPGKIGKHEPYPKRVYTYLSAVYHAIVPLNRNLIDNGPKRRGSAERFWTNDRPSRNKKNVISAEIRHQWGTHFGQ